VVGECVDGVRARISFLVGDQIGEQAAGAGTWEEGVFVEDFLRDWVGETIGVVWPQIAGKVADIASQHDECVWGCTSEATHVADGVAGGVEEVEGAVAEEVMSVKGADFQGPRFDEVDFDDVAVGEVSGEERGFGVFWIAGKEVWSVG